jgi:hypothetical protein
MKCGDQQIHDSLRHIGAFCWQKVRINPIHPRMRFVLRILLISPRKETHLFSNKNSKKII